MNNTDRILEFLEANAPSAFCDDCISKEADVRRRQQVNKICNDLFGQRLIIREDGTCARGHRKKVSTLASPLTPGGRERILKRDGGWQPPETLDIEKTRNEIVRMCLELWRANRTDAPTIRGIAAMINVLRDEELIPRHQANMMLTVCGLRNVNLYGQVQLGGRELAIAASAYDIILEWWMSRTSVKELVTEPPLKPLHSEATLIQLKIEKFSRFSNDALIDSLKPGAPGALKTRPDGTVIDGHHRPKVLRDRGVDVDSLPREIIRKG